MNCYILLVKIENNSITKNNLKFSTNDTDMWIQKQQEMKLLTTSETYESYRDTFYNSDFKMALERVTHLHILCNVQDWKCVRC